MSSIRKIFSAIWLKYVPRNRRLEVIDFKGHRIKVVRGSVRSATDRDDHWLLVLQRNSRIFFDVGANQGFMSLLGFLVNPDRKAFLLEPNRTAMEVAMLNMLHTGNISRCIFIDSFVGGEDFKETKFYTIGAGAAGSMYKSHAESAAVLDSFIMVRTRTLDSIAVEYGVTPDLVKIDVEGAEAFVLDGCVELPRQKATRFFVEMHSNADLPMASNANKVLDWCNRVAYRAWYLKNEEELIHADQIAKRGRCHLLLQPADWGYPDFLKGIAENSALPEILL